MIRDDINRIAGGSLLFILLLACVGIYWRNHVQSPQASAPDAPVVSNTSMRLALYSTSRVYEKAGCGDYALADLTARWALRRGLDAGLVAAVVAVESQCESLAISGHHAVGLMQIHVPDWRKTYDFSKENLFEPETNLRIGTEILAGMIAKHGREKGIEKYCGEGPDARNYAKKVLELAR